MLAGLWENVLKTNIIVVAPVVGGGGWWYIAVSPLPRRGTQGRARVGKKL
jgi:hypothetical protein